MTFQYHQNFKDGLFGKYQQTLARIPSDSSILEVGCHTGYFSRVLIDQGHEVLGLEIDPDAAAKAREAGVNVICGNIEDPSVLAAIGQTFDVILLMDVLEHLRKPSDILQSIRSMLTPKGSLIVTGPNIAFWLIRYSLFFGKWQYEDTGILDRTHLRFYNRQGWIDLLETSGFRVMAWEPAYGALPFQHKMTLIGIPARAVARARTFALRTMPGLFSESYLFHAVPTGSLPDST